MKNYRPNKLNNTQWMDLNIWDYFVIEVGNVEVLISSHPPYPKDTVKCDVLWRAQTIIDKAPYFICWHGASDSRNRPVEYAKERITIAIKKKLKQVA